MENHKRCNLGLWDTTIPGIQFDKEGVSNYAKFFEKLCTDYPKGEVGKVYWEKLVYEIIRKGRGKKYDCIIGVSGGTDSSYLMYLLKTEYKLRPLAVTFDNGWSSEIAIKNIKNITNELNIDLETYVIDYEEMKRIHIAYMRSSIPWVDMPTDFAIKNTLLKYANKFNIKYVINGHDFRTEGTQPNEWTHGDSRQFKYIIRHFGGGKLKSFPYLNFYQQTYLMYVKQIKFITPYYYLDYQKKTAQEYLTKNFNWKYYGGHHHENLFTKFVISYWLPKKFNIEKRKITLSAQILSGEISRDKGIEMLKEPPYDPEQMEKDKNYVIKKLGISDNEFVKIWESENRSIFDYPSYIGIIVKYFKYLKPIIRRIYGKVPTIVYQIEERYNKVK